MKISNITHHILSKGWLLWHRYSSYDNEDSQLLLRSPNGKIVHIEGDFHHAMNGSFGRNVHDGQIVFMAIDNQAPEWDLYLYDIRTASVRNLTPASGYRNEDPKFSPDGEKIIYKRRYWNRREDCFIYEIAEMDLRSGKIRILLSSPDHGRAGGELAMPAYSADGTRIYYTKYTGNGSSICAIPAGRNKESGITDANEANESNESNDVDDANNANAAQTTIFAEEGIQAYYPICPGKNLYFTRWISPENHHDCLVRYDGRKFFPLEVNSQDYDASDICPIEEGTYIFSCTKNGSYDLYLYDQGSLNPLNELNTEWQELGAAWKAK